MARQCNYADLKRNLPFATYLRIMIDPSPDYANEFFLEGISSIICHVSDFSSTVSLNREVPLYRREQVLPNISNLRKAEYRQYVPRAGRFAFFPVARSPMDGKGKRNRERGRYSDIFHFVSNRGIAIRGVVVAASLSKQVVAVPDCAFTRARGWWKTYGKM